MPERTEQELSEIEELVSKVEEAIASLDLHRRFGRLDERHKVHLLTTNRYTTLINSDRGPVSPNPNGNPYDTNIENFMNEEILDPFCWGFVPLNKETEILLKRLGRSPTISGDIITSQEDIYDIYT